MSPVSTGSASIHPALRTWFYLLVVSATWGSGFLLQKLAASDLSPLALAASRGVIGTVALGLWIRLARGDLPRIDPATWRHGIVLGTTNGWIPNALTAVAVTQIDSALAALIQSAAPLMVALLGHFVLAGERIRKEGLLGIGLGMLGLGLMIGPEAIAGAQGTALGGAAMLLTAVSYAIGTVYARWVRPPDALVIGLMQQVVSAVAAGSLALLLDGIAGFHGIGNVLWPILLLGTIGTALPNVLFLRFLSFAPAALASMVGYLQPIWAALLGAVVLGEFLSGLAILGGAITLLGVWLVNRR